MNPIERTILAAQGYYELQMMPEALEELDLLPAEVQRRTDVLETRILVLMHCKQWDAAVHVSEQLCQEAPEEPVGFIHGAFCLHELGHTELAKELLLNGPASLVGEATFHYNLACYECALGNLESAQAYLKTTFSMDKKFIQIAKDDPDLKALNQ